MARKPTRSDNESDEESSKHVSITHQRKKPQLEKSHPLMNKDGIIDRNVPFIDILRYYGSLGTSERGIRLTYGLTVAEWDKCMAQTPEGSKLTFREHYQQAFAQWEIKRLEMKEQMLDHPDISPQLKYKIIQDGLRTMPEHSPVTANSEASASAPSFAGYEIVVVKREDVAASEGTDDSTE